MDDLLLTPARPARADTSEAPRAWDAVRTVALTKRFGDHVALDGLDLVVPRGSVFGYLGPNGAGKTTTIKLLTGLYRPTRGQVLVLGLDVRRERDLVQAHLGYLPSDFAVYPDYTAERFLRLLAHLRGDLDLTRAWALADRFGLDLHRPLGTLSHGNRQKVGIVQAFMHQPELLVLDEPTTGLDPLAQVEFLALVREQRDAGRTVLLSSHVLSEVAAVADAVGVLDRGRLLATRTMAELRDDAVRRLDLTFRDRVPVDALRAVPGVRRLEVTDHTAQLRVAGSTAELLNAAAPYGVEDVRTYETDLAEVFLDYYEPADAR